MTLDRRRLLGLAAGFALSLPAVAPVALAAGARIRVVTYNAGLEYRGQARFDRWLRSVRPDVVMLQEAGEAWVRDTSLADWTHAEVKHRLVLASRFRPAAAEVFPEEGRRHQRRAFEVPLGPGAAVVSIYNFHPISPRQPDGFNRRRAGYAALAKALRMEQPGRPVIVAGDFNALPTETVVVDALSPAGLAVFDAGTLEAPTRFAREFGLPTWIGVPIDHVAGRGPLRPLAREVGPDLGSDHLPVTVDLLLGPEAAAL